MADFDSVLSGLLEDTCVVLDVRSKEEREENGRIPGMKSVPSEKMASSLWMAKLMCLNLVQYTTVYFA